MGEQQCAALRPAIDNSVRILDSTAQENLAEYISRPLRFFAKRKYPARLQLIRRYRLYASRTKGCWDQMPYVAEYAPDGWQASHPGVKPTTDGPGFEPLGDEEDVIVKARKRAWARLLAKVYGVDTLVCPKCGAEMRVIAIIEDPLEIRRILRYLVKIGRSPPQAFA